MKTPLTRALAVALAATVILVCILSLTLCDKKQSPGIAAPTPLPNDAKDKPGTVTAYVKENQALLEEVVQAVSDTAGLSYYYFTRNNDQTISIEKMINKGGTLVRQPVKDKLLEKLASTGFVGELTHSKDTTKGIVSFYTYLSNQDGSHLFVYCPDEAAVKFLYDGFFKGADNVSTTPIVGNWYYVEAK